jgi:catechol 2,3-dioxygenase-like lactoylglutathione lyase family enzyme
MLFVTGQIAMDKDWNVICENDIEWQTEYIFESIKNILAENAKNLETDLPEIWVKHFWLEVENIEKTRKILIEKQIAKNIDIQLWRTWIKYFFIKDPDGILLEIVEDGRKF